jgi:capsular polysaccharide export protein
MIVINSTSAFSALHQNIPVLVLGDAIYRHARLVTLGENSADIRAFLNVRTAASKDDIVAFFDAVRTSALLPGDFYCGSGRQCAARAITSKIDQHIGQVTMQAGAA